MSRKPKKTAETPEEGEQALPTPAAQTPAAAPAAPEPAVETASTAEILETFENDEGDEITMQGLLQEAEAQSQKLKDRRVTTVKVVQVTAENVLVDVGERLEGRVPASDFPQGKL